MSSWCGGDEVWAVSGGSPWVVGRRQLCEEVSALCGRGRLVREGQPALCVRGSQHCEGQPALCARVSQPCVSQPARCVRGSQH